jgi:hypothetical protein
MFSYAWRSQLADSPSEVLPYEPESGAGSQALLRLTSTRPKYKPREVKMKDLKRPRGVNRIILLATVMIALIVLGASCPYMKMKPPPDVDKGPPVPPPPDLDNSCWMATASNMLAAAGYGSGSSVEARAEDIYGDMVGQYGKVDRGWPDAALQWWLGSANNTWTTNPYTVVTVQGTKSMNPWNRSDIPEIIANELRRCQFVGLAFSWPTDTAGKVGYGGHAITAWGDNLGRGASVSLNPTEVRVTDSDRDTGGDVQVYEYDAYNNPNPGGANEGNGCYLDYSGNHPYMRCITTLCSTDDPSDDKMTQIVVGSYKIHQSSKLQATDLHYKVGTDATILSYYTETDWDSEAVPSIAESTPQRRELTVDWDFRGKPVPSCTWVTITTEFVLASWNAITYSDVHFTYPRTVEVEQAELKWAIRTPFVEELKTLQDVTGGYVVGSFRVVDLRDTTDAAVVGEYRLVHQYSFNQSPEMHEFVIQGARGYAVTDLKFGHTYGYIRGEELWAFRDWMTEIKEPVPLSDREMKVTIDWEGRLPYPKGIDIRDALEDIRERK